MTPDRDFDDVLRSYLAEEGRRIEADAPPIEHVAREVTTRVADGQLPSLDRRMSVLLVAALLVAGLVASMLALGRGLLPTPTVIEPDGTVVFATTNQIRTRELDASQSRVSLTGVGHVQYLAPSPDGTRLAFQVVDSAPGETTLWISEGDGRPVKVSEPGPHGLHLDWDPGGTRIAFLADEGHLAVVEAVPPFVRRDIGLPADLSADEAIWHPDGNEVFVRDGATMAVHAVDVETGSVRLVHPPSEEPRAPGADTLWISDDGRRLALFLQREVHIVDLGSGAVTIWEPGGMVGAGALSPDGERLGAVLDDRLLVATPDGDVVHEIALDGGGPISVPNVAFAPDSRRILVVPDGQARGWLVDALTGTADEIDWGLEGGQVIRWLPED
jgi:Tol biopolymer transport system component